MASRATARCLGDGDFIRLTDGVGVVAVVADRVYVGRSGDDAIVVRGPAEELRQWLPGVDGKLSVDSQVAVAERFGLRPLDARGLLAALVERGYARLGPPEPDLHRIRDVAIIGRLEVRLGVASLLGEVGIRWGEVAWPATGDDETASIRSAGCADPEVAIDEAAAACRGKDLAVICLGRAAPDCVEVALADRLVSADIAHVAISANPLPRVGPLVVPGMTACLRCEHLDLADRNPDWAEMSMLWALDPPAAPHRMALSVSCSELRRVLIAVDRRDMRRFPRRVARQASLPFDLVRTASEGGGPWWHRRQQPHPACGCSWAQAFASAPAVAMPGAVTASCRGSA